MITVEVPRSIGEPESIALPNDALFEVIDGAIVEMPPMGTYPVELASILQEHLGPFVRRAGLGRAIVEVLFRIDSRTQYRPDLAFASWPISVARCPTIRRTGDSTHRSVGMRFDGK